MTDRERFYAKVSKQSNGCWLWTAALDTGGYGRIKWKDRIDGAHRMSWELHLGAIPAGMFVCHHCDVKRCVNPYHLFLGTNSDNLQDYLKKGGKLGIRSAKGEKNYRAKLTEQDVRSIRLRLAGGETYAAVARDYPVGALAINRIGRRIAWSHI
jgi:hypothetical protein